MTRPPPTSTLFPYTTLFRSLGEVVHADDVGASVLGRLGLVPLREHRSEEHTSELQSLTNLVCRLLLEKKKTCLTLSSISTSIKTMLMKIRSLIRTMLIM